jgi:hypothetical protein
VSARAPPNVRSRMGRMFQILGIFALIGPPVGAMTFMLAVALLGMGRNVDLAGLSWIGLFALFYGIPFGYLIGIWPAAAAGLLVGAWQSFIGRMRWWMALATGVLVGAGFQIATGQPLLPAGDDSDTLRQQGPLIIGTCVIATLACWSIVRTWYFSSVGPDTEAPRASV